MGAAPIPPSKLPAAADATDAGAQPAAAAGAEAAIAAARATGASIGLVTLNARYVHLALSLRCLRNAAREAGFAGTWLAEYTIQTPLWKVASELLARDPDVLGFSVYIWNRRQTLDLIELVKKQRPQLLVVVGGPEVSFEPEPPTPYVDVVIAGEGECKWVECLTLWAAGRAPAAATRRRWATYGTDLPALERLPYAPEDLVGIGERLAYLETSRGCPYTCSFCLSALDERVRYYPDDAVRAQVQTLVQAGARRIKFLDRTFNLRKARLRELFTWLAGFDGVEFHFEVVGDLLDEALLTQLEHVPPGRFQFEIGIQSAAPETQARVERRQHTERLFQVIRRLIAAERVHLHLDLIWGLPGEGPAEIRASFEQVLALHPHELQLGFLKFLPGAPIRRLIGPHGYVFQDGPPYEVLAHRELPAEDVRALKRLEEVFDLYYNAGHFRFTLRRLLALCPPWEVFTGLADYFAAHDLLVPSHGLEQRAAFLLDWARGAVLGAPPPAAEDAAVPPAVAPSTVPPLVAAPGAAPGVAPGVAPLSEAELLDRLRLDWFFHQRARRAPATLHADAVPTPQAVRDWRKTRPEGAAAAFRHEIALGDGVAVLTPSAAPVWYGFVYPPRGGGYFFQPTLERIA